MLILLTEPSTGSPRVSRQSVTRISMPSLTFAAHARAAMGANGGTILKPSGNSVVETNRSDSSKAAASAARKTAGALDNGSRKKMEATVMVCFSLTSTRKKCLFTIFLFHEIGLQTALGGTKFEM